MSDDEQTSEGPQVIKCRGLPWSATADEIAEFFSECNLMDGSDSIHLTTTKDGRPSGEAYVEMASEEDLEQALKKNRENMGKRYVEVYKVPKTEMDEVIANNGVIPESGPSNSDNVVRLRGLPYEATKQDVYNFFEGLQITNNGILLTTDYQGRASGEAFVQFTSDHHVEKALTKNKQTMGHRYIEVFKSSMMEAQRSQMKDSFRGGRGGGGSGGGMMRGGRPGPYDRMGPGGPGGRGGAYGGGGGGNFGPAGRGSRNFKSFGGGGGGGGGGGDNYYGNDNYAAPGGFGGYGPGPVGPGAGGPPGGRHVVRMRGLPFRVTENDIAEWFSSVVDPIDICIRSNNQGRPTGEADVLFSSEADARRAMSKDKQNMQHRYVELFYDGPAGGGGGGMGMGGGGMGGGGMGMGGGGGGGMGGGAPPMRGYSSGNSYGGYNNY